MDTLSTLAAVAASVPSASESEITCAAPPTTEITESKSRPSCGPNANSTIPLKKRKKRRSFPDDGAKKTTKTNKSKKSRAEAEAKHRAGDVPGHSPGPDEASNDESNMIVRPGLNDVLIGESPDNFHRIGNRRYRVLVELNLSNYFDQASQMQHLQDNAGSTSHKIHPTAKQCQIVESVLKSIRGNVPPGRFLVEQDSSANSLAKSSWRLANEDETRSKIHVTFQAAGRFHMKCALMSQQAMSAMQPNPNATQLSYGNVSTNGNVAERNEMRASIASASPVDAVPSSSDSAALELPRNKSLTAPSQPPPLTGGDRTATETSQGLPCPPRVKVFQALPMDRFFVTETPEQELNYLAPTHYDIMCGQNSKDFFHHFGNRRFRILIEMNVSRYEQCYLAALQAQAHAETQAVTSAIDGSLQKLINETMAAISGHSGRFLGIDMDTGRWRLMNAVFYQLKIEHTFFSCLQVKRRREHQLLAEEMVMRELLEKKLQAEYERMQLMHIESDYRLKERSPGRATHVCSAGQHPPRPDTQLMSLQAQALSALKRKGGGDAVNPNPNAQNMASLLSEFKNKSEESKHILEQLNGVRRNMPAQTHNSAVSSTAGQESSSVHAGGSQGSGLQADGARVDPLMECLGGMLLMKQSQQHN